MTKFANRAQMLSMYALGIGGAANALSENGERLLITRLRDQGSVTIFDVGANLGAYAELALDILGDRAAVHCFEPGPETFAVLEQRLGDRAILHRCALGSEPGEGILHADEALSVFASLHPLRRIKSAITTAVEVDTIERVCAKRGIERIDLLKLDVEGAELDALRGAEPLIEEKRIGLVQFEFGQNSLEARTYMRDFYDLLGRTHKLFRVTPRRLVPLGEYRRALEIFESATNYAAVPM